MSPLRAMLIFAAKALSLAPTLVSAQAVTASSPTWEQTTFDRPTDDGAPGWPAPGDIPAITSFTEFNQCGPEQYLHLIGQHLSFAQDLEVPARYLPYNTAFGPMHAYPERLNITFNDAGYMISLSCG